MRESGLLHSFFARGTECFRSGDFENAVLGLLTCCVGIPFCFLLFLSVCLPTTIMSVCVQQSHKTCVLCAYWEKLKGLPRLKRESFEKFAEVRVWEAHSGLPTLDLKKEIEHWVPGLTVKYGLNICFNHLHPLPNDQKRYSKFLRPQLLTANEKLKKIVEGPQCFSKGYVLVTCGDVHDLKCAEKEGGEIRVGGWVHLEKTGDLLYLTTVELSTSLLLSYTCPCKGHVTLRSASLPQLCKHAVAI